MVDGTCLKNSEELSRKNDIRLNKLGEQLKSMESHIASQKKQFTAHLATQASFEQRVERQFVELFKTLKERVARSKETSVDVYTSQVDVTPAGTGKSTSTDTRSEEKSN